MVRVGEGLVFHYSGPYSKRFWERIEAVKSNKMYKLGVKLQDLEERVIDELLKAESKEI